MNYQRLTNTAIAPFKARKDDAGYDLFSDAHMIVKANGGRAKIPTGIAIEIPSNYVGLVWPRSKISNTYGLDILAGVIDASYRGEIMISLINHGNEDFEVLPKDKIAQILFQSVGYFELTEVNRLSDSERGAKGINDSGLRLR